MNPKVVTFAKWVVLVLAWLLFSPVFYWLAGKCKAYLAFNLIAEYDNTLFAVDSADCPVCGVYGYAL